MLVSVLSSFCGCASKDRTVTYDDATTMDIVLDMGVGINLGNTFDSVGDWINSDDPSAYETAWGSPIVTKKMIQACADAGFGAMRLPVTWTNMASRKDNVISEKLFARVEEVIEWILDSGMYCILNMHHEGWICDASKDYENVMDRYTTLWTQIADRYKDYGDKLVFESMNEIGFDDLWNRWGGDNGKKEALELLSKFNQKFVDIVRASGGNNPKRHLLIASYWTSIDEAVDPLFKLPDDPANRFAVSVHYYTPAVFAILSEDADWGKARTDWGTEADYEELYACMDKAHELVERGIPVIVGEFACCGGNKERDVRELWTYEVAKAAVERNMCPVLWDTPGGELDRENAVMKHPEFIKKLTDLGNRQ